jgi:hypothetical protein
MYAVGKVSRRRAMFGDFLDLPVVFLLAVQPNAQKALVETTERNSTFFKRKGWRAKHNIWFRQKRKTKLSYGLSHGGDCADDRRIPPLVYIYSQF